MTALRLVSLSTHSALELMLGLAVMVLPFALGLSAAAMVAGVAIGALLVGLALQAADGHPYSVSAHHAADNGIAIGLAGAAVLVASVDGPAAVLFGAAAAVQLLLNLTTRYSAP